MSEAGDGHRDRHNDELLRELRRIDGPPGELERELEHLGGDPRQLLDELDRLLEDSPLDKDG